jgi:voltage-gated potassium channel
MTWKLWNWLQGFSEQEKRIIRRFVGLVILPLLLVVTGTTGYYLLEEQYSLLDSLYMTVITLTTVGYGETHPLSPRGRLFTVLLLLGGVFTIAYSASEIFRAVISGEIRQLLGRQRMERSLATLQGHLIVCGYGRMGRQVAGEFSRHGLSFVVLDHQPEQLANFQLPHGYALVGDATSDENLKHAGVDRARALVTVVSSDADNLYITMSARLLNEKLYIVARAEEEEAEQKLMRAGANRVVAPYAIGGSKVAQAVLRPSVVEFIDLATTTGHLELQIEETRLDPSSSLVGKTVISSGLRQKLGIIVVAVKKAQGPTLYTPPGDALLEVGDTLIALGRRPDLDRLDQLAGSSPHRSGIRFLP